MALNKKAEKRIIYVIVINYAIYLLMRLFFYSTYESQLDVMAQAGLSGISGTRTAYILYSNVILGWLLKGLMTVLPFMNWYYMYLCGSVIIALSLIGYVILKRTPNRIGYTALIVLSCFVGYECYILPGSMKTSAVLAAAAIMILADYLEAGALKKRRIYLIGALAALSSMTCFSGFAITTCSGLLSIAVYYGIQNRDEIRAWFNRGGLSKQYIRHFLLIAVCVLVVPLVLRAADAAIYSVSGQENAVRYRSSMVRIYGYGMGEYDENYEEEYGINGAEYAAIKNGSFGVQKKNVWEKLEGISKEDRGISGGKINTFFKKVPLALFKYGIFYLFVVMMCMLHFSPIRKKGIFVCAELILLTVSFLAAYILNAWKNNWMVFVLIVPLLIPVFLSLKNAEEREYSYLWAYLIALSVILFSNFSSGMVSSVIGGGMETVFTDINQKKTYMIDINAYLKLFSASYVYSKDLLSEDNVKISNGAYALMEGFDDEVMTGYPTKRKAYQWIYNPKNLNTQDLILTANSR